jgi:hypothetical protein
MQKYSDVVLDGSNKPVSGAIVTVTTYPAGGVATIYAADGGPPVAFVTTDLSGRFSFYAANGHYSLTVTGSGIAPVTYNDVTLFDPSDLSASGGAGLVGFQQVGTGAVARKLQDELRESVKLTQFIQPTDTSAHQALQRAHDALPAAGGTISMPEGTYTMTGGIVATKNLRLRGAGKLMTILKCTGNNSGQPFIKQTGGDVLGFEDMALCGNGTTAGPIADAGSIGYQAANNSYSLNCDFIFWETVTTWAGGYYHKHINSFFEYCKTLFSGYDQNNISFFGCRWANFQTGMAVVSGEGPISFIGGSIENVADKAFTSSTGRQIALTMAGVYVENGTTTNCPSGITSSTGKFDHCTLVYSNGPEIYPISITGCTIYTAGLFRAVYSDNASGVSGVNLTSKGNRFIARNTGPTDAIYSLTGANISCELHDEIIGALPAGAVYVGGLPASLSGCTVFDPVNRVHLTPVQSWTNATMQNAWTNGSNAGYTVDRTGRVQLRGTVSGGSASAATMFTLPAALVPSVGKFFVCSYNAGFVGVRVLASGAVYLDATVGPSMNSINLDTISFYPGS